jgi:FkbM family methyltransferase
MATLFPQAQVILVEPSHSNFNTALANTWRMPNVRQEQGAVWGHDTFVQLKRKTANGMERKKFGDEWGLMVEERESADGQAAMSIIPGFGILHLLQKHKLEEISFLKVDIEGEFN